MSTGRNESCPCGSGKKHKRCCWESTQFVEAKKAHADAVDERAAWLEREQTPEGRRENDRAKHKSRMALATVLGMVGAVGLPTTRR